jgi:hypothetical protein
MLAVAGSKRLVGRMPTVGPLAAARMRLLRREPPLAPPDPLGCRPGARLSRAARRERQSAYLAQIANTSSVLLACQRAGVSRSVLYADWRRDPAFCRREALAVEDFRDLVRLQVAQRAFAGADLFLIALAKALLPEYRPTQRQEHAMADALPSRFTLTLAPCADLSAPGGR